MPVIQPFYPFIKRSCHVTREKTRKTGLQRRFVRMAGSALDHGFRSMVVADATATRDLPHPPGAGVVDAAAVHAATLAALSDRFSIVVQHTGALSDS